LKEALAKELAAAAPPPPPEPVAAPRPDTTADPTTAGTDQPQEEKPQEKTEEEKKAEEAKAKEAAADNAELAAATKVEITAAQTAFLASDGMDLEDLFGGELEAETPDEEGEAPPEGEAAPEVDATGEPKEASTADPTIAAPADGTVPATADATTAPATGTAAPATAPAGTTAAPTTATPTAAKPAPKPVVKKPPPPPPKPEIVVKSIADQLEEMSAKPEIETLGPKKDPNAVVADKKSVAKMMHKLKMKAKRIQKMLRMKKFREFQKKKIAIRLAKAKHRIAMRKYRRALRKGLKVKKPEAPKVASNREVLQHLKKRFKKIKQKLQSLNDRMGKNSMKSNTPMNDPPFAKNRRMLLVQNFEEDPISGRRRLVGLSQLDVSRDVMDFKFITDSDQESAPIEYFLKMKEWNKNGMSVQVDYKNPLLVGKGNDNVATSLKNMALFAPASGDKPLPASAGSKVSGAPPQVPKGVDEEQIKQDANTAMKGLLAVVIAMVVIQIAVKGNFKDYWALFFILQLLAYSHYYDTPIPGNAEIYIHELTSLVELSFLDPDAIIRLWNPEWNEKLEVIDPDAHVLVWNDVKLYLLIMLAFAVVVTLMLIASLVKALRKSFSSGLAIIKTKFVWDYTLQFFYMAYLKLCITVMNQIDLSVRSSNFLRQNDQDWAWVIGTLLVLLPVGAFVFLSKKQGLEKTEVRAKWQNLYQDAALYRNRFAKYYTVAFSVRRILFIAIPMMWAEPMMQIMWFMFFHTIYMVLYVAVNPHVDRKRTLVEIFNEMCLMVCMYHLAGWNGLIADPQMSFDMGYSFIGLILVTLTINIGVIVYRTVEQWRHKNAVEQSRKLVLQQMKQIKSVDEMEAEKKAIRQKIRDEFIRKRMTEATPIPAKGAVGKRNKVASEFSTPAKGKKVSGKSAKKHMNTIAEIDEFGEDTERKQAHAMAAPNAINVVAAQQSIDEHQSIDTMLKPKQTVEDEL